MPNSQQTAIYSPDLQVTDSSVVFCCPEDLLAAHPPAFDPRQPFYILLRMRYNPSSQQIILEDVEKPTRYTVLANQISNFQVTRLHRIGLRLQIERQTTIKDSLGNLKPIKYHLVDILQLPE